MRYKRFVSMPGEDSGQSTFMPMSAWMSSGSRKVTSKALWLMRSHAVLSQMDVGASLAQTETGMD